MHHRLGKYTLLDTGEGMDQPARPDLVLRGLQCIASESHSIPMTDIDGVMARRGRVCGVLVASE